MVGAFSAPEGTYALLHEQSYNTSMKDGKKKEDPRINHGSA